MVCSSEYVLFIDILNFPGLMYCSYHLSAFSFISNLLLRASRSRLWSTVLKAAKRLSIVTGVTSCLSMAHSRSLTNFIRLVSQLWNFLYADWYSGSR